MSQAITIKNEDILHQVKLSCQIPQIIEEIVARKIIATAIAEAGLTVETEELQKAADGMRLMKKLENTEAAWAWLEKHSLSLDDFEEIVYHNVSSIKLAQHLFGDRVESYFFSHQQDYAGVVMYEIVLDDKDLAIELFYSISEGESSFPEVAHQYIQEPELRRRGGYRGVVSRQEMKPEISAAVFAAQPPQILKPIVTSQGVHLILVDEIIPAQLDAQRRSQILATLFKSWLQQKIDEVEILRE